MGLPDPDPTSAPGSSAPLPLRDLLNQIVDVEEVQIVEGVPLVRVGATFYVVPHGDWGEACASFLEAELATDPTPKNVRVVEHDKAGIGFVKPDDARFQPGG